MSISKSDIVLSAAGRDQGRIFFVLDTDGVYATIADGKIRKVEHPKRKKLKHLRLAGRSDSYVAERLWPSTARNITVRTKEESKSWQKTT